MTIELLGGSAAKIQNTTVLSGLSLLELGEFYIVTAELGEESLQRILKILLEASRQSGMQKYSKPSLKMRTPFCAMWFFTL